MRIVVPKEELGDSIKLHWLLLYYTYERFLHNLTRLTKNKSKDSSLKYYLIIQ